MGMSRVASVLSPRFSLSLPLQQGSLTSSKVAGFQAVVFQT